MIANILHELSIALGYDEPYDPRRIPLQRSAKRIDYNGLKNVLFNTPQMGEINSHALSDSSYKLVDVDYLRTFLKENPVNKRNYVPEKHDCDDFSFILMGDITRWDSDLAFGIVWGRTPSGSGHAWNFFIDTNEKMWFVEPMRDTIFEPSRLWHISRIIM